MGMPAGERASEAEPRTPWAPLAGVIATVSVFAVAQGLSYPLLAFILERQGTSAGMIGLSSAMTPLGLIAGSPLIPPLVRRIGAGPLALSCAIVAALALALIGWTQDLIAWFPLRFLVGVAIGPLYVLSEVWIIGLAPPQRRGRILGIYTAVISAGFAAGPVSLMLVGTEGWPPFAVGVAAFIGCALFLGALGRRLPRLDDGKTHASVRSFLPHAPVLLFAVFATAAFEQSVLSLLPIYGLSYGLGEAEMSALLAVLVAGNIALQAPLGLAAEHWTVRSVLVACALATALGCALLPVLIDTPLVWPLVFLWGALSFGIYTLALVELGEGFSGSMLIAGNAAFALFWGVGGIAGPPATGGLMDWVGLQALPTGLGLMYLALAAVRLFRR
jgi:MFS family permease